VLHAGRLTPAIGTARLDIATIGLAMAGHPAGALAGAEDDSRVGDSGPVAAEGLT
jgi:hypothetical protein